MPDFRKFYINGRWIQATSRETLKVTDPASEQPFAEIALATTEDVAHAVSAARAAFQLGVIASIEVRRDLLANLYTLYKRRHKEIGRLISQEIGAPIDMALRKQGPAGLRHIRTILQTLDEFEWEQTNRSGTARIIHEPIGVCGLITPWNWPMNQICAKVVPAIAAGCSIVLKPSEMAPLSAMLFAEIMDEAGFPAGVFNLVNGTGSETGAALSSHPDVDMISLTGSTRAGKAVSIAAADSIKRVTLELGGKSPNLIFADANVEAAVKQGVKACFYHSGQSCNLPSRMLVESSVYDEALRFAKKIGEARKVGLPSQHGSHMGPLVSAAQFDKVQSLIASGIDQGATLLLGGLGKPAGFETGYFVRPTIFCDAIPDMRIAREEIFGPVLCMMPFTDENQAVELANNSSYGLASYIYTRDTNKAQRVAKRLRAGMVQINGASHPSDAPFGGYKQSGNGREFGLYGMLEFLELKTISRPADEQKLRQRKKPMKSQQPVKQSDNKALEWAAKHLAFKSSKRTNKTPWSRTYALDDLGFLKVASDPVRRALNTTPILATSFPDLVPEVIAYNEPLAALLVKNSEGSTLNTSHKNEPLSILTACARMQAQACNMPDLLKALPQVEINTLLSRLLQFLDPATNTTKALPISATELFGKTKSKSLFKAFSLRKNLLQAFLEKSKTLPVTLNHTNLQADKITVQSDSQFSIYNWELAIAGPAGVSLHALFDGCATPARILANQEESDTSEEDLQSQQILNNYIDVLANNGYASKTELEASLPAAICAGTIHNILWYTRFPVVGRSYGKNVSRHLETRLKDLMALCDDLAPTHRETALACARNYRKNGKLERAQKILHQYLSINPQDAEAHSKLAHVLYQRGNQDKAIAAYRKAIALAPNNPILHEELGIVLMENLRYKEAAASLGEAKKISRSPTRVEEQIKRLASLRLSDEIAHRQHELPILTLTEAEFTAGKWQREKLMLATQLYREFGVLQINNAFDEELINACKDHFFENYTEYFTDKTHPKALNIGNKRYQIALTLKGSLNNPELYANSFIMALMKQLLSHEFIIGCTACVPSLPGAKNQHWHKDHRALFTKSGNENPMPLPPFAITIMVPFVELDEKIGTTAVKKGSHLLSNSDSDKLPELKPMVPVGSCFLMDMRLSHRGLANQTNKIRPMLNMVYQQSWFNDNKNYTRHPPLHVPPEEYEKIPEKHLPLFRWGISHGPRINR